jgi:hypothetical protein
MNNLKITLVFAVVISLTVSIMLSLVPLAVATANLQEDCEKSGGKWVVSGNNGFCYTTLEPEHCTMPRIEVPDPEFCGISTDPTPTPSVCTPTEGATNTTAGRAAVAAGGRGANQSTILEVRMQIEEACMALQTGDAQGAMMNIDLALNALSDSNGTQGGNITNATPTDTNNSDTGTTTPTTPTTDEDGTDTTDTGTTAAQPPADSAQEGDPVPGNPEPPTPNPYPGAAETTTDNAEESESDETPTSGDPIPDCAPQAC